MQLQIESDKLLCSVDPKLFMFWLENWLTHLNCCWILSNHIARDEQCCPHNFSHTLIRWERESDRDRERERELGRGGECEREGRSSKCNSVE